MLLFADENASNVNTNRNLNNAFPKDDAENLHVLCKKFPSSELLCVNGNSDEETGYREEFASLNRKSCNEEYPECQNANNENLMFSPTTCLQAIENDPSCFDRVCTSLSDEDNSVTDAINMKNDSHSNDIVSKKTAPAGEINTNMSVHTPNIPLETKASSLSIHEPSSEGGKMVTPLSCTNNDNEIVQSCVISNLNNPNDLIKEGNDDSMFMTKQNHQEYLPVASTLVCSKEYKNKEFNQDDSKNYQDSENDES